LNEYISILIFLEFFTGKTEDYKQTLKHEEILIILCEDLESAEIIIDGKDS
jgi:hypothetical protein